MVLRQHHGDFIFCDHIRNYIHNTSITTNCSLFLNKSSATYVIVEVAPLFIMCGTQDIDTVVDAKNLGRETLFVHDRYPGGMGYARRCLDHFDNIMHAIKDVVNHCGCKDGCPSCVGSALPSFAMTDLDSAVRARIPIKIAVRFLLDVLL